MSSTYSELSISPHMTETSEQFPQSLSVTFFLWTALLPRGLDLAVGKLMAPKKKQAAKPGKQSTITATALPVLKKPSDHFGRQMQVPGAYWQGRMTDEERKKLYRCTLREFELIHKWEDGRPPSNAFQLQEMGELGEGSLEHGDASGEIFWMPYPLPFLKYFYDSFPELMPKPKGESAVEAAALAGESVAVKKEVSKPDVHPDFPHLRLGKSEVYKYWAINSDTLVEVGPKSGEYAAEFQCLLDNDDGCACGQKVRLFHKRDRACSTTNLISHQKNCPQKSHQEAYKKIQECSSNWITLDGGEVVQKYTFPENFAHLVDLLWLRAAGLSQALMEKDEFRDYVRGYDARASFPDHRTMHRIAAAVHALQQAERLDRIRKLKHLFKSRPCLGLQLDMWTDSNTHTSFAVRASHHLLHIIELAPFAICAPRMNGDHPSRCSLNPRPLGCSLNPHLLLAVHQHDHRSRADLQDYRAAAFRAE